MSDAGEAMHDVRVIRADVAIACCRASAGAAPTDLYPDPDLELVGRALIGLGASWIAVSIASATSPALANKLAPSASNADPPEAIQSSMLLIAADVALAMPAVWCANCIDAPSAIKPAPNNIAWVPVTLNCSIAVSSCPLGS